jgi:hypothetical protein
MKIKQKDTANINNEENTDAEKVIYVEKKEAENVNKEVKNDIKRSPMKRR